MNKNNYSRLILVILSCLPLLQLSANEHKHHNMSEMDHSAMPVNKAPASIMGNHLHHQGGWMLSYRFMTMNMQGLQTGTNSTSSASALLQYSMVPDEMTMNMHMLGMMYAPSNHLTLMVMANFIDQDMTSFMMPMNGNMMNMSDAMSADTMSVKMKSDGLADLHLSALIAAFTGKQYRSHFTLGVGLPVGDIDQSRHNMMGEDVLMGYPMQIGSETTDIIAGFTFVYERQQWQLGSQINYQTPIEHNDANYKPGDDILWHNWISLGVNEALSFSARISYLDKGNYSGHDDRLNPMMMLTGDPKQQGVNQFDWAIGAVYGFTSGPLNKQRIAVEYSQPIEQDFDGTQLKTDWQATIAWQMSF